MPTYETLLVRADREPYPQVGIEEQVSCGDRLGASFEQRSLNGVQERPSESNNSDRD